ncbi:hypothetical protein NA56DRAFT_650990 [Hyaloscypha hepaticicola]|uniref:Uncharacterized protein n=1 Tax=Hyaloscypha hepaticicola TaxID=2082293 RepID=A0A2J6PK50_9HELO|nr:hypothetical protein NA56DRAFT_650990 [Hyaloscypha hepaticicola]
MLELRDRIAAIDRALQDEQEVEFPRRPDTPVRHSLDHRFDKTAPEVDAAPAPTPAQEKPNSFESLDSPSEKRYYDSIAAAYGLGILDEDEFIEYVVYDAFITNLRICPVHLTDSGHYYYVEHRSFLPHVPGVILRHGTDKQGKCLGVAHLPLTGANTFGVGDFEASPLSVKWEKMENTGFWTHMKYKLVHELDNGEERVFNWIRTRNNILDDQGDLVLVQEGKEELVFAEYLGKGLLKWKKRGRLRIREMKTFGETWELVVLLTWASVVELSRRRARVRRYSPTHLIGI